MPTIESETPLSDGAIASLLAVPESALRRIGSFLHKTTHRDVSFRVLEVDAAASNIARRSDIAAGAGEFSDASRRDLAMGVPQRRSLSLADDARVFPDQPALLRAGTESTGSAVGAASVEGVSAAATASAGSAIEDVD